MNERRLTRKQVHAIVSEGAKLRPDLMSCFEETYASGAVNQPRVYELDGDRFLLVFDEHDVSIPGKGDIYPGDYFRRFARWSQRMRDDPVWSLSSVSHWFQFSKLKDQLPANVGPLIAELENAAGFDPDVLDFTYASLDAVSRHVDAMGGDAAAVSLYDNLVAYVGEVIRVRTKGAWTLDNGRPTEPYPFIEAPDHAPIMPINVVWGQLDGLNPVDLRHAAANEVRSARARGF